MQYERFMALFCTRYFVWAPDPQGLRTWACSFLLYNEVILWSPFMVSINGRKLFQRLLWKIENRDLKRMLTCRFLRFHRNGLIDSGAWYIFHNAIIYRIFIQISYVFVHHVLSANLLKFFKNNSKLFGKLSIFLPPW